MEIVNLAAYKFTSIPDPDSWRPPVKARCQQLGVMGSILFSQEGVNLFVAAERPAIDEFVHYLRTDELFEGRFTDLIIKESVSEKQPHKRIVVRMKSEIITMKHPMVVHPLDEERLQSNRHNSKNGSTRVTTMREERLYCSILATILK